MNEEDTQPRPVRFRDISPALEFCAWVVVALTPLLRLANGAPVTDDQWWGQVVVGVVALVVAVGLRGWNWRVRQADLALAERAQTECRD